MGKRAQEKIQKKLMSEQSDLPPKKALFHWKNLWHPYLLVGILAFALVIGYPLITNSVWYKKHVKKITGEELFVETANEGLITTEKGQIIFKFERKTAPKTTENFIRLAARHYYDNLTFHRVEPGFVIQGGDPKGDGTGGTSAWGGPFEDEIDPANPVYVQGYTEGTVAMANSGVNTNGSQFFITLADQPSLPKNYTIFGRVESGMDVVKRIEKGDKMTKVEVR